MLMTPFSSFAIQVICHIDCNGVLRFSIWYQGLGLICKRVLSLELEWILSQLIRLHPSWATRPFIYLILPLGSRVLDWNSWNHVLDIFKSKLALWKTQHFSMGGRLTLTKSVLNSISIYALSIQMLTVRVPKLFSKSYEHVSLERF